MRYPPALAAVAAAVVAAGGFVAVPLAAADPLPGASSAERSLRGASAGTVSISKDQAGRARAVTTEPGRPLRRADGVPAKAPADQAARAFLTRHAAALGLPDKGAGLKTARVERTRQGNQIVKFQQQVGGVPVIAGDVVVATEPDGDVLSVTNETTPTTSTAAPRVSKADAERTAVTSTARHEKVAAKRLRGTATHRVYDPQLIGAPGAAGGRSVWEVQVEDGAEVHNVVVVDATLGTVSLAYDKHLTAKSRLVCDYNNARLTVDPNCTATNAVRKEGGPARNLADVDRAYDYSGATYDFYQSRFGRDSIDGRGMQLRSSVRVCFDGVQCPYPNAYWYQGQMTYGQGFASADDVVAHELSHGVTEYTSGLIYAFQPGAINESLSDVFGEFIDQTYSPAGTKDGAAYNWQLGEDLPIGAIRDMATPTRFGDPDRMTSPLYFPYQDTDGDGYADDNGGVHYNSGIGNKAAQLMVAGGRFNRVNVTGIGMDKAAQIYYLTQSLLSAGSDYADLAAALDNACKQLAVAGTAGIKTADCAQVRNATNAVAMSSPPAATNAKTPVAPVCPTGSAPSYLFQDDLENGGARWTTPSQYFKHDTTSRMARHGKGSLLGVTSTVSGEGTASGAAEMSAPITVPTGRTTYYWFAHHHTFEYWMGVDYDHGRVEYSVNGGGWQNASGLFTENGPSADGRFRRDSRGYVGSRLDLTSLHGKQVRLRFVVEGDLSYPSPWAIDDVKAYTCDAAKAGPVRDFHVDIDGLGYELRWTRPDIGGPSPVTGYRLTSTPAGGPTSNTYAWSATPTGISGGWFPNLAQAYTVTVTPMSGDVAGTPTVVTIRPTTTRLTKPSRIGTTVTVGGVVYAGIVPPGTTPPGRAAVADNGTVTVYSRVKGTTAWSVVGIATVGKTGVFSVKQSTSATLEYQAKYNGGRAFHISASTVVTS